MPDTKITALTALTAADPANDVLPIVDVSDTTMAASGTTKKISINNVLGASGTATLASATITGDLTVDTSTLKVDSANNRVGIGTASPALPFVVSNAGAQGFEINPNGSIISGGIDILSYNRSTSLYKGAGFAAESYLFRVGTVSATDAMTLNSTGLGVGTIPGGSTGSSKIAVVGGATYDGNFDIIANFTNSTASAAKGVLLGYNNSTNNGIISAAYGSGTEGLTFWTHNGSSWGQRMELTATGNVGIGVTPSAWASIYKTVEFANGSSIWGQTDIPQLSLQTNAFLNSSFQWIYKTTAAASNYRQTAGAHLWFTAPSGTAGNVITFTERLRLKETGQLRFVPLASDPAGAEAGDVYYNSTSNKLKCYNGTTWNDLF